MKFASTECPMVGFLRVYMALVDKSLALVATTQSAKFFLIRFVQKSEEITSDKSHVFLLFVSTLPVLSPVQNP